MRIWLVKPKCGDMASNMDVKTKFNELSVLAPLLVVYTLAYLALMGLDFAAKSEFDMPAGLMAVYFTLLLAYAADKEIRRWAGKETPPRKGILFVYLWLTFYLVVFIIHSLKSDYPLPNDLTYVTLQVLGIFFGSKISKSIFQSRAQKLVDAVLEKVAPGTERPVNEPVPATAKVEVPPTLPHDGRENKQEELVLDMIRKNGQVKREDILPALGISRSSVGRLLEKMEEKGLITQIGDRKASHYVLGGSK